MFCELSIPNHKMTTPFFNNVQDYRHYLGIGPQECAEVLDKTYLYLRSIKNKPTGQLL